MRARRILLIAALLTPGCDVALDCDDPAADGWDPAHAEPEEAMLDAVNARRDAGATCRGTEMPPVAPLTMEPRLRCAARSHSVDMATQNYFAHVAPSGAGVDSRVDRVGYDWTVLSENLQGGREVADDAVQALMESTTGHCENIMDGAVTEAGMGLAFAAESDLRWYWTQVFAAP